MNRLLLSLFLLFSVSWAFAQTAGFNRLYSDVPGNNLGNNIISVYDGYLISGTTVIGGDYHQFMVKLNLDGEMDWSRTYLLDSFQLGGGRLGSLVQTLDSDFAVCGELIDPDTSPGSYVLYLDTNGDSISHFKQKEFSVYDYSSFFSVCTTLDSGLAFVGYAHDYDSDRRNDILLVVLDRNGSLSWFETYGQNSWERGFDIEQLPDSGFLIGYQDWDGDQDTDCGLLRVDAQGNVIWDRIFDNSEWEDGATRFLIDGDHIYAGMGKITEDIPNSSFYNGKISVAKLSIDNQLIWWNDYGVPKVGDGPFQVKMDRDSHLLLVSKSQQLDYYAETAAWVLKINQEGDSLFETRYTAVYDRPISADSYAWGMDTTLDGGFITAGFASWYDTNTFESAQDLWVVKFDSNGCFDTTFNCWLSDTTDSTDTVGIASYLWRNNSSLELWPNPASDQFNVRYDVESGSGELWLELLDQQGRAVLREPFQGAVMEVNVHHLQSGLYFCVLQSADGQLIARRKLMIGE